jgi:hypothetical protein
MLRQNQSLSVSLSAKIFPSKSCILHKKWDTTHKRAQKIRSGAVSFGADDGFVV